MRLSVLALAFGLLTAAPAVAADVAGSKDHPLVGRYDGSEIQVYATKEFDRVALMQGPIDRAGVNKDGMTGDSWLQLDGKVTRIRYVGPAGRSSLEVIRNVEDGLKAKGFAIVYACDDIDCFVNRKGSIYQLGDILDDTRVGFKYADHSRYILAKLERPEGAVYVSLLVGETRATPISILQVVELKPMETGKIVFVDASAMAKEIGTKGRVALYGIQFDFDKDTLKPDSQPTLEEIAKLLKADPSLSLVVAGHTDNVGGFDYNVDLSRRRAAAVVAALVNGHGIAASRLTAFGDGMSAPIATNETEDGRALNRRVELVRR